MSESIILLSFRQIAPLRLSYFSSFLLSLQKILQIKKSIHKFMGSPVTNVGIAFLNNVVNSGIKMGYKKTGIRNYINSKNKIMKQLTRSLLLIFIGIVALSFFIGCSSGKQVSSVATPLQLTQA